MALLVPGSTVGQPFELALTDATGYYSPADGQGGFDSSIVFTDFQPQWSTTIPCFSLTISHDPSLLTVDAISQGPAIAALNGGTGPDIVFIDVYPDAVSIGAVISLVGAADLLVPAPTVAFVLSYQIAAGGLIGSTTGSSTTLHWQPGPFVPLQAPPSDPPHYTNVCYGDGGLSPVLVDAAVLLVAGPMFRRGDVNEDGSFDIGDAICVLGYLFQAAHVGCPRAMDANADDQVDLADGIAMLGTLFAQGPVPPPPFGQCGTDFTSTVTCLGYTGCP